MKNKREADPQAEGISPRRGKRYFFIGLVCFSLMVGISALDGKVGSPIGAVAVVLGFSALAGVIGTFTDDVRM